MRAISGSPGPYQTRRPWRHRLGGAAIDFTRLWWALLYWNTRKSVHRWRGASGPAPCHDPGGSGRAGETHCDACLGWSQPARFRRVCPLLIVRPDGETVCGVDEKRVRPFWGRALIAYAGLAFSVYLGLSVLAVAALRHRGFPMPYTVVVAPWGWSEFNTLQAKHFLELGKTEHAAGRWDQAALALSVAHNLNTNDTEAGLLLVSIWQVTRPGFADQVFASLIQRATSHEEAADYRYLWFRSLLERGDFPAILRVATEALSTPESRPTHARVWVDALVFATRQTGDRAPLEALCVQPAQLPPEARRVLPFELGLLKSAQADKTPYFTLNAPPPQETYARIHWLRCLIAHGKAEVVLKGMESGGAAALPATEWALLQLDAYAQLHWESSRRQSLATLLANLNSPEVLDRIAANLIRHPNPETNAVLWAWWSERRAQVSGSTFQPLPTYFIPVAGTAQEKGRLSLAIAISESIHPGGNDFWQSLTGYFFDLNALTPIAKFLPGLRPLGLETTYALHERYPDRTPKSPRTQADSFGPTHVTVEESILR